MSERRVYDERFKRETVRLAQEHGDLVVARELGISETVIARWKAAVLAPPESLSPGSNSHESEVAQLERENALLRQEIAILQKAVGICANDSSDPK